MKAILLFALTIFSFSKAVAQKNFYSGYYIDNAGNRIEGSVNAKDFEKLNSKDATVEFVVGGLGEPVIIPVASFTEVGITNDAKFQKFTLNLDDSNYHRIDNSEKYPAYITTTIFLNVIVDGSVSLYSYDSGNGTKFFYKKKENQYPPKQLLYKTYNERNALKENVEFRQQIVNELKCNGDDFDKFSKLKYEKEAIVKVINDYNRCNGGNDTVEFTNDKIKHIKTNFSVFAGISMISANVSDKTFSPEKQNVIGFSGGLEMELLTPSDKWAFFSRIGAEIVKADFRDEHPAAQSTNDIRIGVYELSTTSFNIFLGGRYYFKPEVKSRLFAHAGIGMAVSSDTSSKIVYYETPTETLEGSRYVVENKPNIYFGIGLGYVINQKIAIELNFESPKKIVDEASFSISYMKLGIGGRYIF